MLSNFDSLERPPQPPPKQRNLDSKNVIDTRTLGMFFHTFFLKVVLSELLYVPSGHQNIPHRFLHKLRLISGFDDTI